MTDRPERVEEPRVERWHGWVREMAPCDRFWKRLEREKPERPTSQDAG